MKLNDFLNLNRQVNGQAAGGTSGLPTIPAPDNSLKVRIPNEMRDVINQQKAEMRAGIFADPAANPAYGGTVAKGYSDLKRAFSEVAENPFSAVADDALAQMRTAAGQTVREQQGVMDYNTLGNAQAAEDWRRANNVAAGDTPPWQQNDPVWRPERMEAEEDARQEQYASAQLRRDHAQSILDAVNAEMRSRRRNTLAQMPLTDLEAEYARAQQTGGGRGGAERLTDLREAVVEKRPDFAELSKKVNTNVMNDIYMGANGIFRGNPSATAITANQMDGRERAVYNYLYNTTGLEEANRYYEELKPTLQVRADQRGREFTREMAKDPVMATILNVADVLASPARGASALAGVASSAVTGQPIDIYSPQFGLVRANRNINEATSEAIGGGVGSFLYGTAKSIAENLYMVALTQGAGSIAAGAAEGQALAAIGKAAENAQLAIMGTNAASAAILDAKEKGWSDEQAVVGGFLAGVAEAAFEKISLERLLNGQATKGVKAGIVNALKQGGVEASEEVFTELANALTNSLVGGDKSDFALAVKEAMANGANEEQARQAAIAQIARNVALAGLGGFISGGVMGGGKSILDSAGQTGGITQRQTASVQTETTPQQAGQSAVAEAESTTEPAARRAAVDAAVLAQLQADRNLPRGTGAASSGFSATEGNTGNVAVDRVAVGPDGQGQTEQMQISGLDAQAMGQKASEQAVANAQQAATDEEAIQTIAGEIGEEQTVLNAMRSTPTRTNLPLAANLTLETADGSEAVTGEQYLDAYRHATEADARSMDMLALEQRLNEADAAIAAAIASREEAAINRAILEREAWQEHADLMRYRQYVESGEGDVSRFVKNVLHMEDIRDNPIMVEALAGDYGRHVVQHHWMTEQMADQILSDEKTTREALQAIITGKGPTAEQALAVWELAQEDIREGRFGDALDKTIAINRAMTRSGRFSDSARLMYADRSPETVLLNMMSMMEGQTTTEEGRESLDRLTKAVKKADDDVIRQSADQLAKSIDGDVQAAEDQQRTAQRDTVRDMQNAIRRQDNSSEALARKIRNTAEKFKKDADLTKDEQLTRRMVNDLYEIARATAENDEDLRKLNELSPWDFAREALTNRDQYRKVWEGARDLIRTKYANDADMQTVIEQWGRRWLDDEAFYGTVDFFDQVLAPLIRRSMREQGFTWRSFYDGAANVSQDAFAADFANRLGLEPGTEIYDQVTEWLNRRISQKVDTAYANLRQSLNEGQPEQDQWEAVLRQALIENGITMREVVADYYNGEQRDNLVQHILNRLGMTGEQAEAVRSELNRQLYEANENARQQRLERLLRTNSTDVGRLRREGVGLSIRKGTSRSAERLIEILVNGGAEQDYRSALSQVYGIPTLNEDQAVRILNLARQLEGLDPRTREYNEIYNQIVDVMSENVAMRPGEAFTALIKTGMLSNIKTHVTNIGGTGASAQVRKANNAISAGLERLLRVAPEDRRHSAFASAGKEGKARENVAKEAWDNYVGYMYRRTGGYIDPNTSVGKRYDRIFNGTNPATRTINALSGFLSNTLEREDEMWAKQVFVDAAASAMKAQGVTEMTDEIAEYAMQEALFYTFHRSTRLSKVMKTIKESGPVGRVIDVGVLPFTGTPSDLITQALVDYNPIVQAAALIKNRIQNGYDASDIVERVGKGLTGTALYALGMALFQAGVLHLTDGSDKEKKLSQAQNLDDYSLRIGNLNINISNVQPYLIPLTQGAVFAQLVNDLASEDKDVDALKHLLDSMATSVIDTSYFSSLANALQTNPGEDSGGFVGRLAANTAQNLGSMYVPSIVSAIGRSIDNTQRQSYIWGGDNELSRVGLSGVKRLPGVSYNMAEKIDMWGNPLTRSGTGNEGVDALNAVNNLLNPLAVTANQYADDPITQEVSRLFEKGYSAAVPNVPSRKQAGDGYMPTDREYAEYLRALGQLRREFAENMVQSDVYRNASDEDKAKMLGKAYQRAAKAINARFRAEWKADNDE